MDTLAQAIAKAVGQEMREVLNEFKEELKSLPRQTVYNRAPGQRAGPDEITMDESVIPTNVAVAVEATNLEKAAAEEKVVDKSLSESKSKLAGILGRRKKE